MDAGVNCLDGRKRQECAYDSPCPPSSFCVSPIPSPFPLILALLSKLVENETGAFARRSIGDFSHRGCVISETFSFFETCTND